MGRKPKDPALQQRAGNPGRRPVKRKKKVQKAPRSWMMPAFALQPEARAIWDGLCVKWQQLGYIRDVDMPTLSRYATYLAEWVAASDVLAKEGYSIDTETVTGATMKRLHPAASMRKTLEGSLRDIESQFGFNPSNRQLILARVLGQGVRNPEEQGEMFDAPAATDTIDPVAFLTEGMKPTVQ